MQLYNSFAARANGASLSIVMKYTRLAQRLIKNKFTHKKIDFI